jgi:hypothetical protein
MTRSGFDLDRVWALTKRDFTVGGAKKTRNPFADAVKKDVGKTGLSTAKRNFE